MNVVPYFLAYVTPALIVAGALMGGLVTWFPVAFVFVLLPLLDESIGTTAAQETPRARWWHDLPLLLWTPTQLGLTAWVLHRLVTVPATVLETAGLVVSLGVVSGSAGITIAHELMHRHERLHRALAEGLMTLPGYPHFCVEHVHGHHRNVATPRDPATSRLGESVYRFYLRVVPGSLRSAWEIEGERVGRTKGQRLTLRDRRLRHPLLLAVSWAAVAAAFGGLGLAFHVAHGLVAVLLLETVNYLEHYGLARRELAPGVYERVQPEHSWNSSHLVSNWFLFNLARHSDHHYLASRPYEALRHHDGAPQLPAGYSAMLLAALVPPLWFRLMDSRVATWRDQRRAA